MENRRLLPIVALVVSVILFGGAIIFALQSGGGNKTAPTATANRAAVPSPITGTIVALGQTATATPAPTATSEVTPTQPATSTATSATPTTGATATPVVVTTPTAGPPTVATAASGGGSTPAPTAPVPSPAAQPSAAPAAPPTPTPTPPPAPAPSAPAQAQPTPTPVPPPAPVPSAPPTATPVAPTATPIPPPPPPTATKPPVAPQPPATAGRPPTNVGLPVRVTIPSLGVDAAVEQVGVDQDGNMATPEDPWNTGWYAPGTRPGLPGNAAIAGHVDYHGIGPVVFWKLNEIAVGAEVLVTTDSGQTLRFVVQGMEFYEPSNAPLVSIFGPAATPNLNLITCSGTFDPVTRHYDERLVVFTTFVGVQ